MVQLGFSNSVKNEIIPEILDKKLTENGWEFLVRNGIISEWKPVEEVQPALRHEFDKSARERRAHARR